ncbi:MAG: HYR domain-containing protein, partial [Crocinitomicaceae bacterium]
FPIGTTTVTYEVTDASGNTASCSFDVTVNDTENPTITCPADITVNNDVGDCGAVVNYVTPTGADNCPGSVTTLTTGLASGSTFPIGTTTVTYEVTDASGNTTSCSFDVTVNDTENPTITCPADITVNNDVGDCGAVVNYVTPTGADNCPGSTTTLITGLASGSTFPIGTTTVTYEVEDVSGNTASCSFDVTINDTELPTVICPPDQNVFFDASCEHTLQDYTTLSTATDNCAIASVTQTPAAGTVLTADQVVTITVTDIYGNVNNCNFTVFISDNTNPTITCPGDQNVFFDAACEYTLLDYTGMAITADNCGTVTVSQSPAAGTVITANQTITLTADDGNGNTSSCSFEVIPTDNIDPAIGCPPNQNVSFDANCQYTLLDYTGMATTSDNCGPITVTQNPVVGTVITSNQQVTLTATDAAGNTSSCTFDVIPSDNTLPTIVCPPNQNVFYDTNCEYTLPDYTGSAAANDNCGPIVVTQSPSAGTVISLATTVTLTVTDAAGNINTCSFDVIPEDNIPPVITCPSDQIVSLDGNCQYIMTDFTPLATETDNCGGITVTQDIPVGTVILTTQTLTLTAMDAAGNTDQCSFDIQPIDDTPPVISCPTDQNVSFNNNCEFILLDYRLMSVNSDNCGPITLTQSPSAGTAITGPQTVTITAQDAAGNSTNCTFEVNPEDNTPPIITSCPPDQNEYVDNACKYTLPDYTGMLTGIDNCGSFTVSQAPAGGTNVSTNTNVTLTAVDGNGNTSSCNFDVLLSDTISPTINCPPSPLDVYFDVNCEYILQDYTSMGIPYDNCGTTILSQNPPSGTAITGNQIMTLIVQDASGNSDQCTFEIVPQDTIAPVIGCPGNQVSYLNDTCYSVLADYTSMANTSANCEAVIVTQSPTPGTVFNSSQTVVLYGEDASGNISFCSFNVTLTDTIRPQITCPPDIYTCKNKVTFSIPTATDNCGSTSITRITGLPSGSTFPDGPTLMTYVATDGYGNKDTCQFTINVFEKPEGDPSVTDISCYGEQDGSVDLTVNSGNPPFTYQWSNMATTEDINGLSAGTYQVIIVDNEGCRDTVEVEVEEPDTLWIDSEVIDISCFGEVDGEVFVTVNGGTFPYSYNWTPMGAGNSANNLSEGDYTLTIIDARGCEITEIYTINEPDSITLDADISQYPNGWQISEENGSDGWIDLNTTGGTPPFNYSWDNGMTDPYIDQLTAGTYTVYVIDSNGCTQEGTYILDEPLAPVMSNAFSPNGDGLNDVFFIKNIERFPENTLTVMNRWGDVVYEKSGYMNEWDGTPNKGIVIYGDKVPEGSYFYVFDLGNGQDKITGYIVIKRR